MSEAFGRRYDLGRSRYRKLTIEAQIPTHYRRGARCAGAAVRPSTQRCAAHLEPGRHLYGRTSVVLRASADPALW